MDVFARVCEALREDDLRRLREKSRRGVAEQQALVPGRRIHENDAARPRALIGDPRTWCPGQFAIDDIRPRPVEGTNAAALYVGEPHLKQQTAVVEAGVKVRILRSTMGAF